VTQQQMIFHPFNYRNAYERNLVGEVVTVLDDRGWEKQIEIQDERNGSQRLWVANGELYPLPSAHEAFIERITDDIELTPVKTDEDTYISADEIEVAGAVQPS
jgi:hypothetical protein